MAEVVWTRRALRDLDQIWVYIDQFNPLAAQRMASRLRAAGESLAHFPLRARGTARFRELVIVRPYLIRYRVKGERVEILAIRHGAQQPDE